MDHAFSNRLLYVSLFQGFSRLDFLDIVEKTPFDFQKFNPGHPLVQQDEECRSLYIILGGEVEALAESPNHMYRYGECFKAPWVVQAECLFGLHNRYTRSVRAVSEVRAVVLSKQSVCRLMSLYPVFQINFYNALSTFAQQSIRLLWLSNAETLEERFKQFMQNRSLRPSGPKLLYIRMEDLAVELASSRLSVSRMLNDLSEQGLLTYSRGVIKVSALESL